MKREFAMKYRHAAYIFLALVTANAVAAQELPDANNNASMPQVEFDLTGYWQQGDGQIFYFSQDGSSLTSRYPKRSARNNENEIDFTATIHGNLVYGAHRASFARALQEKCSSQIWVGMGLTLNDGRTELTGFRGDRIVDPKNCSVKDSHPLGLVYTRVVDFDPLK